MSEHTEEPWAEGSFCSNMEQMGRLTNVRVIDGPHANIAIVLDADTQKGAANAALIIAAPATARQRDELLAALTNLECQARSLTQEVFDGDIPTAARWADLWAVCNVARVEIDKAKREDADNGKQ